MSSNRVLRKTPSVIDWFRKILASFLIFVSIGAITAAPAFASDKARVKINALIVRQSASLKSKKIATLSKGAIVTVYGIKNNWCKINTGSKTGFVQKQYLQKINTSNNNNNNSNNNNNYDNDDDYSPPDTSDSSNNPDASSGTLSKGAKGDAVEKLQMRLGILNYLTVNSINGSYGDSTELAVKRFQLQAGLPINGKACAATQKMLYSSDAPKRVRVVTKHWFNSNINSLFARNSSATIVDCATGTRIKVVRVQGSNHADLEPATSIDTARLKAIYGGKWSWNTRAVILVVKGELVAASINSMPHGKDFIKNNNFKGQFCMHTTGSRTHGSSCINGDHQSKIIAASKYLQ